MKQIKYIFLLMGVLSIGILWADNTRLSLELKPATGATGQWRNNPPIIVNTSEYEESKEVIEIFNPTFEPIEISLSDAYIGEVPFIHTTESPTIIAPGESIKVPVVIHIPQGYTDPTLPPIKIINHTNQEEFPDVIIYNSAPEDIHSQFIRGDKSAYFQKHEDILLIYEEIENIGQIPWDIAYRITVQDWITRLVLDTKYIQNGEYILPDGVYKIQESLNLKKYWLPTKVTLFIYSPGDKKNFTYTYSQSIFIIPWRLIGVFGILLGGLGVFFIGRSFLWTRHLCETSCTLANIAIQYDVRLSRLAQKNNLPKDATIEKNQEIHIPRFKRSR